jgi:ribosomal protein L16 Arg81 hydroxylase
MKKKTLFNELIGKFSEELFFKNYWGKNWLHLKKEQSPTQHFPISIELLNIFFTDARLRYPWVKLVNKGIEIPIKEYRNEKLSQLTDIIDNDKLFKHLNEGATIVANSIDKNYGPIGIYCRELEKELSVKVWANLYISPPESRGFGIHQDLHDVIIVQLAGKKNWHIYPREVNNGLRTPGPNDIPEVEFQLQENELVYLPKNYPHMAYATGNLPSVHISLSFEGLFWSDLVKHFAKEASEDIDFQQRIPIPKEGKEAFDNFLHAFKEKWLTFNKENNPLDLLAEINSATYHQKSSQKQNRLSDWLGTNHITTETKLQKRAYVAHQLRKHGKKIHLLFHDKKLVFPIFIAPFLDQVLQEKPFKLSDIATQQNEQEKLALAKKLLQEGILTIIDYK